MVFGDWFKFPTFNEDPPKKEEPKAQEEALAPTEDPSDSVAATAATIEAPPVEEPPVETPVVDTDNVVENLEEQKEELLAHDPQPPTPTEAVKEEEEKEETIAKIEETAVVEAKEVAVPPVEQIKEGAQLEGTCRWYNTRRGFGFIVTGEHDKQRDEGFFVHQSAILKEGFRKLTPGEKVTFTTELDGQGRWRAIDVKPEPED